MGTTSRRNQIDINKPDIAIYEESKTVYQRLTKDLLEGQKALLDATLAATTVEVVAGVQ
ncbi:hypothetical protein OCHUTO_0886 [Orientia chuto str. Dubai]|uniref:Uncharacterized protein n=1 Tax=Orientia chuto str. Dubai TaxID=1359168 RepID=A0A0F3MI38_9RICK|nr:hypothetical protein OCHUTO_0886 [Orientia chuto str. Dubai]